MSKESLDNDDDSMTVWEGMPQAAMSPSSVASRGSKTLVGPADLVSPATQTLNMLSQNMDDLRYNMAATETSMMEHEPSTATTELNTPVIVDDNTNTNQPLSLPPPDPKSCIPLDEWKSYYQLHYDWIPVTFVASGTSLGMVIQRDQFFSAPPHRQTGLTHCKILRVLPGGVADGSGIHVDDWICRPISGAPILALFEEVQTWAKTKNFEVSVLRLKKYQPTIKAMNFSPTMHRMPSTKSITASSGKNILKQKEKKKQNQQRPPINANRDLLPLKKRRKRETFSEKITDNPINKPSLAVLNSKSSPTKKLGQNTSTTVFEPDEILPFCRLCNHLKNYGERGRPRIHHAWCPQSSFFENNGGKDLLGRIQHGCKQLNCSACEKEFQLGKLQSPNTHSQLCLQNQERLNKIIQEKGRNEEREQTAKDEKDSRQRKQQQKKRALLVSPSSDEEDEEVSAYRPPRKKKQPETFPSAAAKKITKLKNQKDGKPEEKATLSTISTSQPLHRVTPTPVEALAKPVASALLQKIVDRAPKNQQSDSTTIKMRWESTRENPWGAQGHQDGDIVLYGPQHGLGHVETLIPSPRYCLYPFNPNSNYRTTHFTPEEGYSVLYLSRDPLGVNPWGFGVTRDEFGHACLVDHIQPFTPATGAKAVGSEEVAGLKVHDMVVMVNGRSVGGMTEVSIEIELETSGPHLALVVSRYKHAEAAAEQLAAMERNVLRVMDTACRDNRLLGWHEVGNAALYTSSILKQRQLEFVDDSTATGSSNRTNETARVDQTMDQQSLSGSKMQETEGHEKLPDYSTDDNTHTHLSLNHHSFLKLEASSGKSNEGDPKSSDFENSVGRDVEHDSEEWENDQNAWNGCVCGTIHSQAGRMFWIQCEGCDSWYDVSERCIGFTAKKAKSIKRWTCWACGDNQNSSSPNFRKLRTSKPTPQCADSKGREQEFEDKEIRCQENKAALETSIDGDTYHSRIVSIRHERDDKSAAKAVHSEQEVADSLNTTGRGQATKQHKNGKRKKIVMKKKNSRPPAHKRRLVRTAEGNLLSNSTLTKNPDGTFRRPPGVAPQGFVWDKYVGLWTPGGSEDLSLTADSKRHANARNHRDTTGGSSRQSSPRNLQFLNHGVKPCRSRRPAIVSEEISGTGDVHVTFEKGDLIFVEGHAWPGWNCQGGIGHVIKSYFDKDSGNRSYDIKYVIGGSAKNIAAEFVRAYSFR